MPDELIVPVAALPPATPFTCHVTAVFDDPVTVALNDCVAPARTFALAGETETVTLDPEGGVAGIGGRRTLGRARATGERRSRQQKNGRH